MCVYIYIYIYISCIVIMMCIIDMCLWTFTFVSSAAQAEAAAAEARRASWTARGGSWSGFARERHMTTEHSVETHKFLTKEPYALLIKL